MPFDPKRVKDIFSAAVEKRTSAERAAYLQEACGADAELLERIQALLREHEASTGPLGAPADGGKGTIAQTPEEIAAKSKRRERSGESDLKGQVIAGRYKLLQKLGEGGMGTVWMAEQTEPVRRMIALKIIKAGMDSEYVLARFEAERQALAMMDHPNIAKVLDGGVTGEPSRVSDRVSNPVADATRLAIGRPFFVMELVKGIPITKYCDQEHLTPQQRLELFIPICHAVQHAHQKGVIHRDLKPSNILIALYDGKPVPKVIDFGIAKATSQKLTEKTLFTEVGQIIGTLEYMPPEQAEMNNLDIDTRADIYSLGVVLYELLAGSTPFSGRQLRDAGFIEMMRIIREVEPQKPSTKLSSSEALASIAANRKLEPKRLTKQVSGDLDWIVMKCLEKERSRRYDTANGLAMDIQRYLTDEPVEAGRPSAGYRLRKFVRRNRGGVMAGMLVFFVLLAGIVGTTVGLFEARSSERLAKSEQKRADEEAINARKQEEIAKERAGEAFKQTGIAKINEDEAKKQEGIAKDKAVQALQARNELATANDELTGSLARALRGPIGVDSRIMAATAYEVEALHELAARRGSPVSYRFLDEIIRTPSTCQQAANRAEFIFQAAIGLDPELRARSQILLQDRLRAQDLPEGQRINLALVWCRSELSSPEMDLHVAAILTRAITDERGPVAKSDLTEALGMVAGRLDRRKAAELCGKAARSIPEAMTRYNLSVLSLRARTEALGPLNDWLEPATAAEVYDKVVRYLVEAIGKATEPFDRAYIAEAVASVASRLKPRKVAKLCDAASLVLLDEMGKTRDAVNLSKLARDLASVAGWMERTRAAETSDNASRLMTNAMDKTKDSDALSHLAWGLATLAGRMEPNAAAIILTRQMTKTSNPEVVGYLARGLAPVLGRMEPERAVKVCEQSAEHIAKAMADSAVKLSAFPYLAEGLGATAGRLEPGKAAVLCTKAVSNLARMITNDPSQSVRRVNWLAEALTFLVGRMESGKAAEICGKVVPDLAVALANESNLYEASRLAQSMIKLASHMEPGKAIAFREQATRALTEAMGTITSPDREYQRALARSIINCLAAGTLGFTPMELDCVNRSAILVFTGLGSPPHLLSTLPFLHPQPRPLPPQTLVDLLKHSFCVRDARRTVLNALAFTYNRPFANQWDFVRFVQENKLPIDILSPPKRPHLDIRGNLAKGDVWNAQAERDLSVSLIKIGDEQLENGDSKAALASYQRSLDIREKLAKGSPRNVQAQRDLSVSLIKVGNLQLESRDSKAGLITYVRWLEIREELLAANALDPGEIYDTACGFALCFPLAEKPATKEKYALRAVELLKLAAAKGFGDVAHIKKDADLDALRQRDDFKKFLAELEAKTAPKKEPLEKK